MYHTVIEDEEGNIVDIASNSVYDRETFNRIFKGTMICKSSKAELYEKLSEASCEIPYHEPLILALKAQKDKVE